MKMVTVTQLYSKEQCRGQVSWGTKCSAVDGQHFWEQPRVTAAHCHSGQPPDFLTVAQGGHCRLEKWTAVKWKCEIQRYLSVILKYMTHCIICLIYMKPGPATLIKPPPQDKGINFKAALSVRWGRHLRAMHLDIQCQEISQQTTKVPLVGSLIEETGFRVGWAGLTFCWYGTRTCHIPWQGMMQSHTWQSFLRGQR